MNIKIVFDKVTNFTLKRLSELIGLLFLVLSILLLTSLITYSPEDSNFIFPNNSEIKNLLGIKGSYVSDIFYQSIGLISLLIPFSIFFSGMHMFRKKNLIVLIENLFFIILYSIIGSLFFTVFHQETYWLTINGNNGFVGNFFEQSFLINLIKLNQNISYYLLLLIITILFLLSINFNLKSTFKNLLNLFKKNNKVETKIEEEESAQKEKSIFHENS